MGALLLAIVGLIIIIVVLRKIFGPGHGKKNGGVAVLRGSEVGEAQARRNDKGRASPSGDIRIDIGGVSIEPRTEAKHFLFSGATGSGKTQGINQILKVIRARRARAIVADAGGAAVERFYQPGDLILNPFDGRSVSWSPFTEIRSDYDCSRLAKAAIPDAEGESREWHVYAQTLLGETLRALYAQRNFSVERLMYFLTAAEPAALLQLLQGTAAEMFCREGSEKMLANTRAILGAFLVAWRYLPDEGQFSTRQWVRDENDTRWLFVTYREDQFEMLRYLIPTILDLAVVESLSLSENEDRQIWFILDEVDSLGKVGSLRHAVSKLRKYGGRCVLGLQTIAQLRSTYGKDEAQTLMANLATKVILRAGDGETAEYFSQEFGNQEVERTQLSRSTTMQGGFGTSRTRNTVRETRRTVLESEIAALRDLEGYLKTPGSLARIQLAFEKPAKQTDAFVSAT
jgi:type IV secretory pathway TraG/TraD family ATPase VirD4